MFEFALWMILLLPLLGSVVVAIAARRWFAEESHWPTIVGAIGACGFAILAFIGVMSYGTIETGKDAPCISAGNFAANLTLMADGLTPVMTVMVTVIGSLIAIYVLGYMKF